MKQLLWLLFVSLFPGLCLSLEAAQCRTSYRGGGNTMSSCCDTRSGKTCFTIFLGTNNHTVRKPFEEASRWCKSPVLGSSLIIIDSPESRSTVESFIGGQLFENETIIIDAQKLSGRNSTEWSWVNGHPTVPIDVSAEHSDDGACVKSEDGQSLAYCTGYVESQYRYICEYSDSKSAFNDRQNNKSYVASEGVATWLDAREECLRLGGDLASITNLQTIQDWVLLKLNQNQSYWIGLHRNRWIWNSTGDAITYTNWNGGYPDESSDKQCICINPPRCRTDNNQTMCEHDRKWRTCNCNHNYTIVCQREETSDALKTEIVASTRKPTHNIANLQTSTARTNSTIRSATPVITTKPTTSTRTPNGTTPTTATTSTKTSIDTTPTTTTTSTKTPSATAPTTATTTATTPPFKPVTSSVTTHTTTTVDNTAGEIYTKTASSSSFAHQQSSHFAEIQTTAFASSSTGQLNSFSTKEILLVILLLVAAVFIVAAVFLIIRKRKYDRRNDGSPMMNTKQSETVSSVYATVVPAKRPSEGTVPPGNTIYTDVEMIKQPTPPTSNTIYASVQPTSEAVDMHGKTVVYADLNIPQKDQHKPSSADKITVSLSPIYSQPYNPPTPASNTEYAEPFKPDKTHTATAPVLNPIPAGEAIPMDDPSVIYSEVNKPTKSSTPVDKAVKATDPIYLEAIEVKPGVGSGGVATQDPSAVYAEPIKLEKLP